MSTYQRLIPVIRAFMNAGSWDESREILERHPELLTSEVAAAMATFERNAEEAGDSDAAHAFGIHRALLLRCAEIGTDSAFREMDGSDIEPTLSPGLGVPREVLTEELLTLSRELWMVAPDAPSPQWWDRRIRLCERGIALTETRPDAAPLCATFHVELANTLQTTPTGNWSVNLERAIESFEKAGQVWTADVAPEQWATIQDNLGNVYDRRILGDPQDNRARAAECYRAAAAARGEEPAESLELETLLHELADPSAQTPPRRRMATCERVIELVSPPDDACLPVWIAAHITLAECLESLPDGDRAENLEGAIVALDTALAVCDRNRLPEQWAAANAVLGVVHYERVRGDRAENLERAIRGYELALQVRTRAAEPAVWAATTNNLANAYWRRVHGSRGQNLETAIGLLDDALTVRTRERVPEKWAASRLNLGNAYQDRIVGDRAQNLEQAVACYRDVLSVWGQDRTPDEWAMAMNNLGATYVQRSLGDPGLNIETAIVIFESALKVRRRDRSPAAWAETTRNLANAYCLRVRDTRAQNIDDAISTFEQVLGCPRELFPSEWAMAQIGVGNAYSERAHGDRAEDIERAIAAYKSVLGTSEPGLEAAALLGLGNAFLDRVRHGRAENIEMAIRYLEDAQRVATRAAMPREWATVQHGLGCAFAIRRLGDRSTNLVAAVSAFERALEIRTPADIPLACVMTQQNLGGVLMTPELPGDRSALQERALALLESALRVVSADSMPFRWAELSNNLGAVYAKRLAGDPAANLHAAVAAFTAAAGVWAEQAASVAWAQAQRNLGSALGALSGMASEGASKNDLVDRAFACFERALQVYRAERRVSETRDTATSWGDLAYRAGRWRAAASAYEIALDAIDLLYATSVLSTSKRSELGDGAAVFQRAAYAWAKAAETGNESHALLRAVVAVERGRARWLGEALEQHHGDLTEAETHDPAAVARYRDAAARLRDLEGIERSSRASAAPAGSLGVGDIGDLVRRGDDRLTDELRAAHDELAAAIADIRAIGGRFETFLASPDFEAVASTVSCEDALVYLVGTAAGCVALLVCRPDGGSPSVRAVWGVGLASQALNDLLVVRDAAGVVRGGYLPGQSYSRPWLEESLATALPMLGERLVGPIADQLRSVGAAGVAIVACGLLGTLPLHAVRYWRDDEQRRLIDDFDVSFVPSARVLATVRSLVSAPSRSSASLAGVGNPTSAQPLRFAATELDEVADLFVEPRPFYEDGATKQALTAAARDATYVHLACHGEFDMTDPLSSGLRLAHEERLTLREILSDRPFAAARLVVASACKTAVFDVSEIPDEVLGLPAGFLSAGTPGVIGTLWSVDDQSTAILMARFYQFHLRGDTATGEGAMTPPRALRRAQQWLSAATVADIDAFLQGSNARTTAGRRDLWPDDEADADPLTSITGSGERPFADPYYWAPFVFLGA